MHRGAAILDPRPWGEAAPRDRLDHPGHVALTGEPIDHGQAQHGHVDPTVAAQIQDAALGGELCPPIEAVRPGLARFVRRPAGRRHRIAHGLDAADIDEAGHPALRRQRRQVARTQGGHRPMGWGLVDVRFAGSRRVAREVEDPLDPVEQAAQGLGFGQITPPPSDGRVGPEAPGPLGVPGQDRDPSTLPEQGRHQTPSHLAGGAGHQDWELSEPSHQWLPLGHAGRGAEGPSHRDLPLVGGLLRGATSRTEPQAARHQAQTIHTC